MIGFTTCAAAMVRAQDRVLSTNEIQEVLQDALLIL